jgi:curved DNA-binding protein CbpA
VRLHRRLDKLAPHELLGVAADADLATVRKAYFAASKELHPDRQFGRDVGPFKAMLSEIFARLTKAFESLEAERDRRR